MRAVALTLGDLTEEHGHSRCADPRQDQAVHHAVVRADSGEGVDVLALEPSTHDRSAATRRPAAPRHAQQAEASLVLEHQPHAAGAFSLARDLAAYQAAAFF